MITPEPAGAVRRGEAERMLGVEAGLGVACRYRLLRQTSDEGGRGRVAREKLGDRVGDGRAGHRIRQLSPQELEKFLRSLRGKPLDRVGQDVEIGRASCRERG